MKPGREASVIRTVRVSKRATLAMIERERRDVAACSDRGSAIPSRASVPGALAAEV